jgi:glycine betaine/choline ABC-type transport system substrate-binding protein|tara:strand:+ start:446 stop:619 length:174 start_codon:yes stop_codon:yes gene_type:complete
MVAEKKVFKMDGLNHVDSVKKTDLYKVLTYLSWNTAKNDYEVAVQEKIHNKNNITLQ